jgi:hypothetical protein
VLFPYVPLPRSSQPPSPFLERGHLVMFLISLLHGVFVFSSCILCLFAFNIFALHSIAISTV